MTSSFRRVAVDYFETEVGHGMIQRIDGIRCFSPLPRFWFWRFRLAILVKRGLLVKTGFPSIWRSLDGMAAYGIADRSA
ncbi:hypothetical protein G6L37_00140 [Agrobacterium rubi]|nr:hypothetical protein [Agrobacterium rubi]NTF23659.1 hypothetical protein [Agrobacterium rubi]